MRYPTTSPDRRVRVLLRFSNSLIPTISQYNILISLSGGSLRAGSAYPPSRCSPDRPKSCFKLFMHTILTIPINSLTYLVTYLLLYLRTYGIYSYDCMLICSYRGNQISPEVQNPPFMPTISCHTMHTHWMICT